MNKFRLDNSNKQAKLEDSELAGKEDHEVDEDEDGPPEEHGIKERPPDRRKDIQCKYFSKGRCRKGRHCPFKHDAALKAAAVKQTAEPSKLSILHALLEKEIHCSQDIIFDVIRLLDAHNYLLNDEVETDSDEDDSDQDEEDLDSESNDKEGNDPEQ